MLKTEQRNPNTTHIDKMSASEMVAIMQQENLNAAKAVAAVSDAIAASRYRSVVSLIYPSGL